MSSSRPAIQPVVDPHRQLRFPILLPLLLVSLAQTNLRAEGFERTERGIRLEAADTRVQVEVVTDAILRVTAQPLGALPKTTSYMIAEDAYEDVDWSIEEDEPAVILKTERLQARVDRQSGQVLFHDADGAPLLREVAGGRSFEPAEVLGEPTYHVHQSFWLDEVQAIHGLGAQQSGIGNYKGRDALLLQYNTVDVNTFFQTDRNWGLLWDNNSITRFGDPRDWEELGSLKLYNASGEAGGLTAEYFSDDAFRDLHTRRDESLITYEFLSSFEDAPEDFDFQTGSVRWTGEIEANESGTHKLRVYSSSYFKLWIDDEQVLDSWRTNWMPWKDLIELEMQVGERRSLRIEWKANAGYAAVNVLPPEPEDYDRKIMLTSEVGEQVDYYFVHGDNADDVVRQYRHLTGRAPIMPLWAFGKWQSRERYKSQEEVLDTVREFRRRGIPLDNIVQDWFYWREDDWGSHDFDPSRFPDPEGMIATLHDDLHARIMISVWPKFYVDTEYFDQMDSEGWLYRRSIDLRVKDWIGYVSTFYDAFAPEAGEFFWKTLHDKLFRKGIDAWWLDATEPDIESNISVEERKRRMHPTATGSGARNFNAFSIANSQSVYEGQRQADPDKRVFILTRSAFAGQQRYATATWSGDVAARWSDFRKQIAAGMNFSASGIPYWTHDIGGFAVEPRYEDATGEDLEEFRELNVRWYQFGAFSPLFRVHGQYPFREIYNIAPDDHPAYGAMLSYDQLRYRLLPYIYSIAGSVTFDGDTFMHPLTMDFPKDEQVHDLADQYMFGPAFLVAPVTEYRARERQLYLPEGSLWHDFHSGEIHEGGQTITAPAPYAEMPLFVRGGSIVLMGPDLQYSGEKPADPIEVRIYPGADAEFTLYEDEGVNYNYEKGAFSRIPIHWNDRTRTLVIGEREGSFPGMLEERSFRIVDASRHPGIGGEHSPSADATLTYRGKRLEIPL